MPVEEKNSGRESKHCYLEVKVPEGSAGVSGQQTFEVLRAQDTDRQQINVSEMLARW